MRTISFGLRLELILVNEGIKIDGNDENSPKFKTIVLTANAARHYFEILTRYNETCDEM